MKKHLVAASSASNAPKLSTPKTILIFIMAFFSVSAPALFGKLDFFQVNEPSLMALLIGVIVGIFSYLVLRYVYPEFTSSATISTAAILGLISAHVAVYHVVDKIPSVPVYALFIFLFYFHFDEGVEFLEGSSGEAH